VTRSGARGRGGHDVDGARRGDRVHRDVGVVVDRLRAGEGPVAVEVEGEVVAAHRRGHRLVVGPAVAGGDDVGQGRALLRLELPQADAREGAGDVAHVEGHQQRAVAAADVLHGAGAVPCGGELQCATAAGTTADDAGVEL